MQPLALGVIVPGSDPLASLARVQSLGLSTCQMMAPDAAWAAPEKDEQVRAASRDTGVAITCIFHHFPGETYTDIPTIRRMCGLVPAQFRQERLQIARQQADVAAAWGVDTMAAHIGFVPEDREDPEYRAIVLAMREICDYEHELGLRFGLETGQEKSTDLRRFILDVNRRNLGVNFDPANMLLYGADRPLPSLDVIGEFLFGVHAKDGNWPQTPGTLGQEMPLGQGEVNFPAFIAKLKAVGYSGPLTIEREIEGEQQTADILAAIEMLRGLIAG